MRLEAGQWYRDKSEGIAPHRFKILDVGADTLRVEDLHGNERLVNRMLFQSEMETTPAPSTQRGLPAAPQSRTTALRSR